MTLSSHVFHLHGLGDNGRINKFLEVHRKIEDREGHNQLRDDLIEHLWQLHGWQVWF